MHGYWLSDGPGPPQRMGHVGLSPRAVQPIEYTWALDDRRAVNASGTATTLRAAKRAVERAFRANYSWRFPASRDKPWFP